MEEGEEEEKAGSAQDGETAEMESRWGGVEMPNSQIPPGQNHSGVAGTVPGRRIRVFHRGHLLALGESVSQSASPALWPDRFPPSPSVILRFRLDPDH